MHIRTIVLGGLVAGFLTLSAAPLMARDYWRWSDADREWSRHSDVRSDYRDLREARRQLAYDRAHRATQRRIAEDRRRVRQIESDLRVDRGY